MYMTLMTVPFGPFLDKIFTRFSYPVSTFLSKTTLYNIMIHNLTLSIKFRNFKRLSFYTFLLHKTFLFFSNFSLSEPGVVVVSYNVILQVI